MARIAAGPAASITSVHCRGDRPAVVLQTHLAAPPAPRLKVVHGRLVQAGAAPEDIDRNAIRRDELLG